jgi:inosose dehydratase
MKLATAPVNWNNNDAPDYREWTPYPQLIKEMVAAGYSATEWGMNMPKEPGVMNADLQRYGLQMLGGFVGLELRNGARQKDEIGRALEIGRFFKSIGGSYLIAADSGDEKRLGQAGHVDPAGGLTSEQWRNLGQGLNDLGRLLQDEGVELMFHNHVGTYVETGVETARLLQVTDPGVVGWCLDCGHLAYGGGNTLEMLQEHGDRVRYVHIKDVDGKVLQRSQEENWSFQAALKGFIFAPLGEGIARIPDVIRALEDHHYNGWLVVEQDTTPADPTEIARQNRIYLERLVNKKRL